MLASRYAVVGAGFTLLAFLVVGPRATAADPLSSAQGKVTLDGRPLPGGRILFHLDDDQFVGAKIKADGTFKVDRVPVGTHKVTVEFKGLPARFASEERSALRVEVKKGANTLDFALSSK
jgi:hypothetical protein